MEPAQIVEVERSWKGTPFVGTFPHTLSNFLCTAPSHPSYEDHSQTVRSHTRRKLKDIQFKVDDQFPTIYPLDGIYLVYILFPAGKTSPFIDRAGFKGVCSRTSPD